MKILKDGRKVTDSTLDYIKEILRTYSHIEMRPVATLYISERTIRKIASREEENIQQLVLVFDDYDASIRYTKMDLTPGEYNLNALFGEEIKWDY